MSRLKIVGVLILLLGLVGAGLVYWTGAPTDDLSADPATARAYKSDARNIEINLGKTGLLMNSLLHDLKHPGTQAVIILFASMLVASGCFYFARFQVHGDKSDGPTV